MAELTLNHLRKLFRDSTGKELEIGNTNTAVVDALAPDDGREPLELLSRIYAHIGHRLPFVKKVEKRLEGRENRSGILADLGAFVAQLYRRNKPAIDEFISQVQESAKQKKGANAVTPEGSPNGGERKFTPVHPIGERQ